VEENFLVMKAKKHFDILCMFAWRKYVVELLSENSSLKKRENFWIYSFFCSFFAPLWGVGYVLPFLLIFMLILPGTWNPKNVTRFIGKRHVRVLFFIFSIFLILVFFSSVLHDDSKWGSTEGFWVVLSAFLFWGFGTVVGFGTETGKLGSLLKSFFCVGFALVILTTFLSSKKFNGGVWGNMNDLTTAVLMITGAICGFFLGDMPKAGYARTGIFLLPFIAFAFYFAVRISSSDAALLLLVAFFFSLSILVPEGKTFLLLWFFFLFILCVGIVFLVFNEPFNFKSLLSTKRLESFLGLRPQVWLASLSLIKDNPLTGIGSGLYKEFYEALLPLLPGKRVLSHSHCLYLVHFVAHGIFAGLSFITLIAMNLRMILSSLNFERTAPFALMAGGIWFFALSYGLVELTPASREMVPLVWGSSGLLTGILAKEEQ